MMGECYRRPDTKVVATIDIELYEALRGNQFVGQTGRFSLNNPDGQPPGSVPTAWAALVNTCKNKDLYITAITLSNFTGISASPPGLPATNFVAHIFLVPKLTNLPTIPKQYISPTNLNKNCPSCASIINAPGQIYSTDPAGVFERIVPAAQTTVDDDDGKFIIPPGGAFLIQLNTPEGVPAENLENAASVAFGWFEKESKNHC